METNPSELGWVKTGWTKHGREAAIFRILLPNHGRFVSAPDNFVGWLLKTFLQVTVISFHYIATYKCFIQGKKKKKMGVSFHFVVSYKCAYSLWVIHTHNLILGSYSVLSTQ